MLANHSLGKLERTGRLRFEPGYDLCQSGNRDHIEAGLGKVRPSAEGWGELGLNEQFSVFVDGLEWLNDTMRLNGAL